tara:strand:+ start:583 stop:1296 length:714 start_codon:yes stop_codon:yes gene_type:complete
MKRFLSLSVFMFFVTSPATVLADETGFFAGLDVLGGIAGGSSDTTNGGAPFAGGGVVRDVDFGNTIGAGGHVGYRFTPAVSTFLSYQHIRGDISWTADFPLFGAASDYEGTAISNVVMGNIAYDHPLSNRLAVRGSLGLGLTFNSLSGITETDNPSGVFISDVQDETKISPVAQIGAGLRYHARDNIALGLDALFAYSGDFKTGNTRSGNLGVTSINPYEIEDVWRASLGVSLTIGF